MKKDKGILLLAFGKEFDKLTAASVSYSRQFTNLPICVLTNLYPDERSKKWQGICDVSFQHINLTQNKNRFVKVSLIKYTPFSQTLFMDSDAVIQKKNIEDVFSCLDGSVSIVCQHFATLQSLDDKNFERSFIEKTYHKLANILGASYPIELYGEAAFLFSKTKEAQEFFRLWKRYWTLMGEGRDMPAFSFAVKHMRNNVLAYNSNTKFCTNAENEDFYIQHKGFSGFEKKFNLPEYIDWNPKL